MYRNACNAVSDLRDRGFNGFEYSTRDESYKKGKALLKPGGFDVIESHRFCMPAEKGSDILVYGIVLHGSSVKGILITERSDPALLQTLFS